MLYKILDYINFGVSCLKISYHMKSVWTQITHFTHIEFLHHICFWYNMYCMKVNQIAFFDDSMLNNIYCMKVNQIAFFEQTASKYHITQKCMNSHHTLCNSSTNLAGWNMLCCHHLWFYYICLFDDSVINNMYCMKVDQTT